MEEKLLCLMKTIDAHCGEGNYHVFSGDDFLDCFCSDDAQSAPQKEELAALLGVLAERGFIGIKYAREGMYCLCARPSLKDFFERKRQERSEREAQREHEQALQNKWFLCAFLGGAAGSAATALFLRLMSWIF